MSCTSHHSFHQPQLMGVALLFFIVNSIVVNGINAHLSGGVNYFSSFENDPDVYNLPFLIVKKGEIAGARLIDKINEHSLFTLLP